MLSADDLRLVSPDVIRLSARHGHTESPHVEWWIDYAPEPEDDVSGRVVFATLHAFEAAGGGEVTVASIVKYPESQAPSSDEFEEALRDSDAIETLYDFARTVLRSVTSLVEADPDVEREAPAAKFGLLTRADADPDDGTQ